MRRSRGLFAVIMALGFGPTATAAAAGERTAPVITDTRDPESLQADWRWIGVLRRGQHDCPKPSPAGVWTTQTLFAVDPPADGDPPPEGEAPVLHEFCVYETAQENPGRPFENPSPAFRSLDRDFMGLMPSGGLIENAFANELSSHFASQAGDVALPTVASRLPVRLAIVDTAATREVGAEDHRGTSKHGFTLLNLADGLLCGTTGCVAKVTARLALAWKCFEKGRRDAACRDADDGGYYGLPGELAQAIHREVLDWRAEDPGKKLVLNLSLGWDSALGGLEPSDSDVPAPALAVRTALDHAVCKGALVIAAAGNRGGGPTAEVGALLPAAWETRPAPTEDRCRDLEVTVDPKNFPAPGELPYRPLVFAAGGVRAGNGPLFNSRTNAEPRLVAFGDHAKGPALGAPGSGWTGLLTGTSVSAVVVSAAAAAAWYYDTGLKPYEVPDTVYAGGTLVGRTAQVCLGGSPCADVKRVTVCGAAAAAGAVPKESCPDPKPIDISNVDLSGITFKHKVTARLPNQTRLPSCQMETLSYGTSFPADPCPHWQYYPREPRARTEPQPGAETACPGCPYDPELAMLYIEIDSGFDGTVSGGILKCGDLTYSLGLPPMGAGATATVADVYCAAADPIQLSFTVDANSSDTSDVLETGPQGP